MSKLFPLYEESQRRFSAQTEYLGSDKPVNRIQPLVSVCVATYQHGGFIAQCLDGALMQKTSFPYEIIVGEDESTDETRAICIDYADRYPDKIRLFLRSRTLSTWNDNGKTRPFNGIWCRRSARGKYVAICEGDDYWTDPEKLQKQVDYLEAHPECGLCFHNVGIEDSTGHYTGKPTYAHNCRRLPLERDATFTIADTFPGGLIPTCSVVLRNEQDIRNPPDFFYRTLTGDWLLWLLTCKDRTMFYFHRPMAVYRPTTTGMAHALRQNWNAVYRDRVRMLLALDRYWGYRLHATIAPSLRNYIELLPPGRTSVEAYARYVLAQPLEGTKFAVNHASQKARERLRLVKSRLYRRPATAAHPGPPSRGPQTPP
ncbi:MAG TPA: glycosyltransferase [Verrucomicrobiota bacterium]|nr:hypothetical protein [Verrucomicrobiales bacterium]HRI11751.1 glycosyltransferase [Verrucomicrobiota bacterium]